MLRDKQNVSIDIYGKQDIMKLFNCQSDKALRILKLIFQMKEGIKIGKEYYVERHALLNFLDEYKGEELII